MIPLPQPAPGKFILCDGAWGTELQKRGLPLGQPSDLWNIHHPDQVEAVAKSYVDAGSQILLTNTFRANDISLAEVGAQEKTEQINRRGVELSLSASSGQTPVFGSMGPSGKNLTRGEVAASEVIRAFRRQAEVLAEAGVQGLVLETFSDVQEARLALHGVKVTGLPVVVSFAFGFGELPDRTLQGQTPEMVAKIMSEDGADAIGANCGAGPAAFLEICQRLKDSSSLPVWIKPNAGLPTLENGQAIYSLSPEYFAGFISSFVAAGASYIGGCCGTSPAFIQAIFKMAMAHSLMESA